MPNVFIRYIKFIGTSAVGTLIDTIVLWILSDYVFTDGYWGEYVVSPVLSFQAAVLVNFVISYFYIWKDRVSDARGLRSFLKLYGAYNISCSTVFMLRFGLLLLIERVFGWDVVVCNLAAMCISGIVNFLLSNNLVFRKKPVKNK